MAVMRGTEEEREQYGKTDLVIGKSRAFIACASLLYTLAAVLIICSAADSGDPVLWLAAACAAGLCIWGIQGVHSPVCFLCEEAILIAPEPGGLKERARSFLCPFYVPVQYDEIIGFSDDWRQLYIAHIAGGLVSQPINLFFVSFKDKQKILRYIENKKADHGAPVTEK